MEIGRIFDILAAIVSVALAEVIVNGKNTASVAKAFGDAFSSSLVAAEGR